MTMDPMTVMSNALATLETVLDDHNAREGLCAVVLASGSDVPYDYGAAEGCMGFAWTRLVVTYPTVTFPNQGVLVDNCVWTYAYTVEFGIARPAALPTVAGDIVYPPTPEERAAEADRGYLDMSLLHEMVLRMPAELKVLGTYSPIGPSGDVVGGIWQVTVGDDL